MSVGRKRKDGNPLGLERRVEFHHGQFRYLHRDGSKEPLGKDLGAANARARVYNDPDGLFGTLGYFLDFFIAEAQAGRLHKKRAPRTIVDYRRDAEWLKTMFKATNPLDLVRDPTPIVQYRDNRGAPVRANREISMLSAVYSWLIEKGLVPGLTVNPVKSIARNQETPKDRYVEDTEYQAVYAIAVPSVRMAMETVYRTLQRPSDVLGLPPNPVRVKSVAGVEKRILPVLQSKTKRTVDIEVTPELDVVLGMLAPAPGERVIKLAQRLIHGRGGKGYTETGHGAMLRRYCHKAKVATFGLMDVRAKGATDMYLAGIPLETIQLLMAHKSVQTTEIYIKRLLSTISIATPNQRSALGN